MNLYFYHTFGAILFLFMILLPLRSTLFPYTTLFRSLARCQLRRSVRHTRSPPSGMSRWRTPNDVSASTTALTVRSEEHTSELQSHSDLVCRLLLEKKKFLQISRFANRAYI